MDNHRNEQTGMLSKRDILSYLRKAKLPVSQYWLCAGAALVLHNIKTHTRDIDAGCTPELIHTLLKRGYAVSSARDGSRTVKIGGDIEVFENWIAHDILTIHGIQVASLTDIIRQKTELGREKDLQDIVLIEAFLKRGM